MCVCVLIWHELTGQMHVLCTWYHYTQELDPGAVHGVCKNKAHER